MLKKNKHVEFFDETLRDGVQSLWALRVRYGMFDAVAEEMDQAGFSAIQFGFMFQQTVRLGENPWEIMRLIKRKIKKTALSTVSLPCQMDIFTPFDPPAIWKLYTKKVAEVSGQRHSMFMSNSIDEINRFPEWFPFLRKIGLEICPAICYYPSPRAGDEYFVDLTKRVLKFKQKFAFKILNLC